MDKLQSRVIDLLRYPLAVLVVMCHCGFLDGGGIAVQIFFSETLPHVAVPLFLHFSGYLFFKEGEFDKTLYLRKLKSRFRTLFVPYIIWFLLKKTRGWGILLFAIWWFSAHDKFFGFGADSLLFFSLGALFAMKQANFVQLARKYAIPLYIAAGVMLVVDYLVMYRNYMQYHELRFNWLVFNVYVLCITSATLALAGKLAGKKCSDVLIRLSGASFFLYAAHILWLEPLRDTLLKAMSPTSDAAVILFYFVFIAFHCATVTALYFLMRRFLPKTTAVLTGCRV